jgi:hypothetical protein
MMVAVQPPAAPELVQIADEDGNAGGGEDFDVVVKLQDLKDFYAHYAPDAGMVEKAEHILQQSRAGGHCDYLVEALEQNYGDRPGSEKMKILIAKKMHYTGKATDVEGGAVLPGAVAGSAGEERAEDPAEEAVYTSDEVEAVYTSDEVEAEEEDDEVEKMADAVLVLGGGMTIEDIPEDSFARRQFVKNLQADLSVAMGGKEALSPLRIEVLSIVPGSVVVEVHFQPPVEGVGLSSAEIVMGLKFQLGQLGSPLYQGLLTGAVDGDRSIQETDRVQQLWHKPHQPKQGSFAASEVEREGRRLADERKKKSEERQRRAQEKLRGGPTRGSINDLGSPAVTNVFGSPDIARAGASSPQIPSSQLPPPQQAQWLPATDPASGNTYYYNRETKEVTWTLPAALTPVAVQPAPMQQPAPMPESTSAPAQQPAPVPDPTPAPAQQPGQAQAPQMQHAQHVQQGQQGQQWQQGQLVHLHPHTSLPGSPHTPNLRQMPRQSPHSPAHMQGILQAVPQGVPTQLQLGMHVPQTLGQGWPPARAHEMPPAQQFQQLSAPGASSPAYMLGAAPVTDGGLTPGALMQTPAPNWDVSYIHPEGLAEDFGDDEEDDEPLENIAEVFANAKLEAWWGAPIEAITGDIGLALSEMLQGMSAVRLLPLPVIVGAAGPAMETVSEIVMSANATMEGGGCCCCWFCATVRTEQTLCTMLRYRYQQRHPGEGIDADGPRFPWLDGEEGHKASKSPAAVSEHIRALQLRKGEEGEDAKLAYKKNALDEEESSASTTTARQPSSSGSQSQSAVSSLLHSVGLGAYSKVFGHKGFDDIRLLRMIAVMGDVVDGPTMSGATSTSAAVRILMAQTQLKQGHMAKLQRRLKTIDLIKLGTGGPTSSPGSAPGSTNGPGTNATNIAVPLSTVSGYTWMMSAHGGAADAWIEGRQVSAVLFALGLGRYCEGFVNASSGRGPLTPGPVDEDLHHLLQQSAMAIEQLCAAAQLRAGHAVKLRLHVQRMQADLFKVAFLDFTKGVVQMKGQGKVPNRVTQELTAMHMSQYACALAHAGYDQWWWLQELAVALQAGEGTSSTRAAATQTNGGQPKGMIKSVSTMTQLLAPLLLRRAFDCSGMNVRHRRRLLSQLQLSSTAGPTTGARTARSRTNASYCNKVWQSRLRKGSTEESEWMGPLGPDGRESPVSMQEKTTGGRKNSRLVEMGMATESEAALLGLQTDGVAREDIYSDSDEDDDKGAQPGALNDQRTGDGGQGGGWSVKAIVKWTSLDGWGYYERLCRSKGQIRALINKAAEGKADDTYDEDGAVGSVAKKAALMPLLRRFKEIARVVSLAVATPTKRGSGNRQSVAALTMKEGHMIRLAHCIMCLQQQQGWQQRQLQKLLQSADSILQDTGGRQSPEQPQSQHQHHPYQAQQSPQRYHPLPQAQWLPATDPASGNTYYYNRETKEVTWTLPAALTPVAVQPAPVQQPALMQQAYQPPSPQRQVPMVYNGRSPSTPERAGNRQSLPVSPHTPNIQHSRVPFPSPSRSSRSPVSRQSPQQLEQKLPSRYPWLSPAGSSPGSGNQSRSAQRLVPPLYVPTSPQHPTYQWQQQQQQQQQEYDPMRWKQQQHQRAVQEQHLRHLSPSTAGSPSPGRSARKTRALV